MLAGPFLLLCISEGLERSGRGGRKLPLHKGGYSIYLLREKKNMKKDCLVEFSAGANLNFFALYAFWEHVKFLRRSWKLLKSNRTKTKMYRLSLLCFRIRDKL